MKRISVVGIGYVGLPLALLLSKAGHFVTAIDINQQKINTLQQGKSPIPEIKDDEIAQSNVQFSTNETLVGKSEFVIVAVPTPINTENKPDLTPLKEASKLVGKNITKGTIVVFESTVYPGVTEEVCVPIIDAESSLKQGLDWFVGYSPERVDPGSKEHTIQNIVKIVSGINEETRKKIAALYKTICEKGVHEASSIKVAEAAKVIENIQRDLNIALMNELSVIFHRLKISTEEVIEAASTKWNFHPYHPGLVGGHCIGVDPYYLTFKAQELGYQPNVILAGRMINDSMHLEVVERLKEMLGNLDKRILLLGLTFKENVADFRNSRAKVLIEELKNNGAEVEAMEPLLEEETCLDYFGVKKIDLNNSGIYDAVVVVSPHRIFNSIKLKDFVRQTNIAVLFEVKKLFGHKVAAEAGILYDAL